MQDILQVGKTEGEAGTILNSPPLNHAIKLIL